MFDGFWSGLFGGLFGPAVARWMSRFKYWAIFLLVTLGVHIGLFIALLYLDGAQFAIQSMVKNTLTATGILVPMGIGLLAVAVAFVGTLTSTRKNEKNVKEE